MVQVVNYIPYVILIVSGSLLLLLMGIYVYFQKRHSPVNKSFLMLAIATSAWGIIYSIGLVTITLWPKPTYNLHDLQVIFDEGSFFAISMVGPTFLNMVLELTEKLNMKNRKKILFLIYIFGLVSWGILTYGFIFHRHMYHTAFYIDEHGVFQADRGPLFYLYLTPYNYTMLLLGMGILIYRAYRPRHRIEKRNMSIMTVGVMVGFLGNVIQIAKLHPIPVDITPLALSITALIFAIGILKYGFFIVEPVLEERSDEEQEYSLDLGHTFYVTDVDYGFEIFSDLVKHEVHGIAFTMQDINTIRQRYDIPLTPMFRFHPRPIKDAINPNIDEHRELMEFIINDFTDEAPNSIVLIEGFDRFAEDIQMAKEVINSIKTSIYQRKKGRLLIAIDPVNEAELSDVLTGAIPL